MEYDCEMFDDAEAALDALLAKAQWESLETQASERLRQGIVTQPRGVREPDPERVVAQESAATEATATSEHPAEPVVTRAFAPCEVVAIEQDLPSEVARPEFAGAHKPDARVTQEPVVAELHAEKRALEDRVPVVRIPEERPAAPIRTPPRSWRQPIAVAAGILLLIGAIVIAIHVLPLPSTLLADRYAGPLPGRAPTPLELWQISPAGQKYLQHLAQAPKPAADPRATRIADLCRFANTETLASAALHESSPDDQAKLLNAMLRRRDGVDRFLDLVLNRSTRDRALAMLANLPQPPTDLLLAQLNSPSVAHRFAAAKALGGLCQGDTLPVLVRMIQTGDHQREALAVLSECRDGAAIQYVRQLKKEPAVAAQLSAIQSEMQQLF